MEQIKTIKTTPAGMVEEFNNLCAHKESALIIIALETKQSVYLYYYADSDTARVRYYTANGVLKMDYENQQPDRALSLAMRWTSRALRLWEPYLIAPNKAYYKEDDLGRYSVHSRYTKHGLKYDVVRMAGYKRVSSRNSIHRLFRFQRYFTTDYRGACAIAEYLNAKQYESYPLRFCEVTKRCCDKKITLRWSVGSNITNENFNEKFNITINHPEFTSIFATDKRWRLG